MNNPTKSEIRASIATRKRILEAILIDISTYEKKIKLLREQYTELNNLNQLDEMLLKNLE